VHHYDEDAAVSQEHAAATKLQAISRKIAAKRRVTGMMLKKEGSVTSSEVEKMISSTMVDSSKSRDDDGQHDDDSYTSDYTYPEEDNDGKELIGKPVLSNSVREMLGDDL
jgi:hypothetical protein